MSRYVLTQEQLDRLQEQIHQLSRLNEAKQERIKNLEVHKVRVSGSETTDLIKTIGKLEDQINELHKVNRQLSSEVDSKNENVYKIKELEMLLEEERKLRKYSEAFAKQLEMKCAEEALIRELTTELCQLQKDEIEIDNKKIADLQKKLKMNSGGAEGASKSSRKSIKLEETSNVYAEKNIEKNRHLMAILRELQKQFFDLHEEIRGIPLETKEDEKKKRELEKWLGEIGHVMEDLENIEKLKKDLNYLKEEIDSRKRLVKFKNN